MTPTYSKTSYYSSFRCHEPGALKIHLYYLWMLEFVDPEHLNVVATPIAAAANLQFLAPCLHPPSTNWIRAPLTLWLDLQSLPRSYVSKGKGKGEHIKSRQQRQACEQRTYLERALIISERYRSPQNAMRTVFCKSASSRC